MVGCQCIASGEDAARQPAVSSAAPPSTLCPVAGARQSDTLGDASAPNAASTAVPQLLLRRLTSLLAASLLAPAAVVASSAAEEECVEAAECRPAGQVELALLSTGGGAVGLGDTGAAPLPANVSCCEACPY